MTIGGPWMTIGEPWTAIISCFMPCLEQKIGVLCKVLSAGILQPLGASVHSTKAGLLDRWS